MSDTIHAGTLVAGRLLAVYAHLKDAGFTPVGITVTAGDYLALHALATTPDDDAYSVNSFKGLPVYRAGVTGVIVDE